MTLLAIDDNRDNLTTLKAVLADRLPGVRFLTAQSGPEGLALALAEDPDVILLDIVMPGMDGYAVCRALKDDAQQQATPVLFMTAIRSDRDSRVKALEAGAEGFLSKPFDESELIAQIRAMAKIKAAALQQRDANARLVGLVEERTRALQQSQTAALTLLEELKAENEARKASEKALRRSEEKYRMLFREMLDGFALHEIICDDKGQPSDYRFLALNPAFERLTGLKAEELVGRTVLEVLPGTERRWIENYGKVALTGEPAFFEEYASELKRHFEVTAFRPAPNQFACIFTDVTDRKRAAEEKARLEEQLQQAQKMESVGRLAGGVAHDFNNMLGVILGNTEMAMDQVDPRESLHGDLMEIRKAAERSADLTRQLLAFARKQTVAPKVLNLNPTIDGMLKMMERLVGEAVELFWRPQSELWQVKVDPSQINQILANLCANARDAISDVGKITIETANVVFDGDCCACEADSIPGQYVRLAVSDNGAGMDKATLAHLFEPFFTTKEIGHGTGLGLATVYGIVKQNKGFIRAYSEPGYGTTVKVYLPRHVGKAEQGRPEGAAEPVLLGQETILLVEDEPSMLKLLTRVIERLGYTVLAAATPGAAIRMAQEHPSRIHLLMTDVVMPEMNGRELAKNLLSLNPSLKRLFMSGYTANVIAHHGVLDKGVHFIQKPISLRDIAAKVREVLDGE
jgi:PAS domain S-box-containing protein